MPFSGLINNIRKILAFTFIRPIQRFNVANRAKKYLGPDAKYFEPAPRAIGPMTERGKKPIKYPHLADGKGFKSVQQRRLEALEKKALSTGDEEAEHITDMSEAEKFVVKVSSRLEVKKTIVDQQASKYLPAADKPARIKPGPEITGHEENQVAQKSHRPLPTMTSLQLSDPASIWVVEKTPPGRLNLDQLQEIMLNRIDDPENYWTPERIAERYKIKPEYAATLCNHLKHIRIHVSPRVGKFLEYAGRNDDIYQNSKHLVYIVDNELRSDQDKQFDEMYLPEDKLDDEVKKVVGDIKHNDQTSIEALRANFNRLERQVKPLRIAPLNQAPILAPKLIGDQQPQHINKHLEASKPSKNIST